MPIDLRNRAGTCRRRYQSEFAAGGGECWSACRTATELIGRVERVGRAEEQNVDINLEVGIPLDSSCAQITNRDFEVDVHGYDAQDIHMAMGMDKATNSRSTGFDPEINSRDAISPAVQWPDRNTSYNAELKRTFKQFHTVKPKAELQKSSATVN